MKRLPYIKPEMEISPMSAVTPIATSMSTDQQLGKEHDFDNDYDDFLSSFNRAKEIAPLGDGLSEDLE